MLPLFGADGVPPVAFAVGGGLVGLLDVAEHLVVELIAQGGEVGGDGLGIGIFSIEVGGDFRALLVAEPGVVVAEGDAVEDGFVEILAGDGGDRAFSHSLFKCRGELSGRTDSIESGVWELRPLTSIERAGVGQGLLAVFLCGLGHPRSSSREILRVHDRSK